MVGRAGYAMQQKNIMKSKTCRQCETEFVPSRPLQVVCTNMDCILAAGKAATVKKQASSEKRALQMQRAEIRARKAAMKTLAQWIAEAQTAFNAFIRARDRGLPCICCGAPMTWGQSNTIDAGHYRSRGAAGWLRFNEDNVHAQRKYCNRYRAGRADEMRIGMIAKIGLARVEALENNNTPVKMTITECKNVIALYKTKLKSLRGRE